MSVSPRARHDSTVAPPATTGEKWARILAWITIAWNVTEAVVALVAAHLANSPVLLGFGLDSVVESLSSMVMVWRFHHLERGRHREERALRMVGISLLLLATFIAFDATHSLLSYEIPEVSKLGIALALVSIALMPLLARLKRRIAHEIESGALHADATQTDICWYLAVILLIGVSLNAVFGWWWADPLAALIMVPLIAKEGIDAVQCKTACGSCA